MAEFIVLVRHGETQWAREGRHTSRTDIPLTEQGILAARTLGQVLDGWKFDLILSSPRQRALKTAELALGVDAPVEISEDLAEWDYGLYEGVKTVEIHESFLDWDLWSNGCPEGESPAQITERCTRLVRRLENETGVVACFAHGHILRSLTTRWVDADITLGRALMLDTATISILSYEHGHRALKQWNAPKCP